MLTSPDNNQPEDNWNDNLPEGNRDREVDEYAENKTIWILTEGSDELQQLHLQGYDAETRYLKERIAIEYPGFEITKTKFIKQDSPSIEQVRESLQFENCYCATVPSKQTGSSSLLDILIDTLNDIDSNSNVKHYFVVDNYLNKYTLAKLYKTPHTCNFKKDVIALFKNDAFIASMAVSTILVTMGIALSHRTCSLNKYLYVEMIYTGDMPTTFHSTFPVSPQGQESHP